MFLGLVSFDLALAEQAQLRDAPLISVPSATEFYLIHVVVSFTHRSC